MLIDLERRLDELAEAWSEAEGLLASPGLTAEQAEAASRIVRANRRAFAALMREALVVMRMQLTVSH